MQEKIFIELEKSEGDKWWNIKKAQYYKSIF
jgi:hypothetical protein